MVGEEGFGGPELDGLGALFLDRGLAATSDRWISIRAGSAVGGGSVINWASSLRAPAEVRDEWRAAGVGDDLDEHYAAIEADIGVTSDESPATAPTSDSPRASTRWASRGRSSPATSADCGDCGPCAVGCRRGAKQSVLRRSLASACEHGAEVLDRTEVLRVHRRGRAGRRRRRAGPRRRDHGPGAHGRPGRGLDPLPGGPPAVRDRPGRRRPDPAHPPGDRRLGHLRRADGALVRRPPERHVGRLRGRRGRVGLPRRGRPDAPRAHRERLPVVGQRRAPRDHGARGPDRVLPGDRARPRHRTRGRRTRRHGHRPLRARAAGPGAAPSRGPRAGPAPPRGRRGADRAARDPAARVAPAAGPSSPSSTRSRRARSPPTASCCSPRTR